MSDTIRVTGFQSQEGHVVAHAALGTGPQTVFVWCPGQVPALDEAAERFSEAVRGAIQLAIIDAAPAAPDTLEGVTVVPCRMCGRQDPAGVTDGRGWTWCTEHREYARE